MPDQVFFDNLINIANQCVYTFTYKKLIMCKNFKLQTLSSNINATSR